VGGKPVYRPQIDQQVKTAGKKANRGEAGKQKRHQDFHKEMGQA
jgi:hypothetical protein